MSLTHGLVAEFAIYARAGRGERFKMNVLDYIIVGAGSAGCLLANRLSQSGDRSVLVLEAGPMDRNLAIHIPAAVYKAYRNPGINWNYETEGEAALNERRVWQPRGRVVGGSSSINSMVYMRGHPLDYDNWGRDFDLPDWSYDQCLPYFKACEASDRGGSDWRGDKGELSVSQARLKNTLFDAFLEAGSSAGQGVSDDLNGYKPEGISRYDSTTRNGRRCSAAVAFLRPALKRPNVTLKVKTLVRRIVVEGGRAVGVEYEHNGEVQTAYADREVILSAGAVNSPHLLMLSGIGPADQIRAAGVRSIHDLKGVGQNLQDHVSLLIKYECKKPVTLHRMLDPVQQARVGARWMLDRTGPVASHFWEAGGMVRSGEASDYPDVQYHFGPAGISEEGGGLKLQQAFSLHVNLSRPESTGEIQLTSADPRVKPKIACNFLSTERDRRVFRAGVRRGRELLAQPAFDAFRGQEMTPGAEAQTDEDLTANIRQHAETDFHLSCTCRMGKDDMAVVDGEMRVRGIEALRVVDASVMPRVTSANLNAPTLMIAARAADFILGRQQKEPQTVPLHFREKIPCAYETI